VYGDFENAEQLSKISLYIRSIVTKEGKKKKILSSWEK